MQVDQELAQFIGNQLFEFRSVRVSRTEHENKREIEKQYSLKLKNEVREGLFLKKVSPEKMGVSATHAWQGDTLSLIVVGSEGPIGVDIECHSRVVHSKVFTRITSQNERKWDLDVLEYWVMKEAAFKANLLNRDTCIPDYTLIRWDGVQQEGVIQFPFSKQVCKVKLFRIEIWLIAFAVC